MKNIDYNPNSESQKYEKNLAWLFDIIAEHDEEDGVPVRTLIDGGSGQAHRDAQDGMIISNTIIAALEKGDVEFTDETTTKLAMTKTGNQAVMDFIDKIHG